MGKPTILVASSSGGPEKRWIKEKNLCFHLSAFTSHWQVHVLVLPLLFSTLNLPQIFNMDWKPVTPQKSPGLQHQYGTARTLALMDWEGTSFSVSLPRRQPLLNFPDSGWIMESNLTNLSLNRIHSVSLENLNKSAQATCKQLWSLILKHHLFKPPLKGKIQTQSAFLIENFPSLIGFPSNSQGVFFCHFCINCVLVVLVGRRGDAGGRRVVVFSLGTAAFSISGWWQGSLQSLYRGKSSSWNVKPKHSLRK